MVRTIPLRSSVKEFLVVRCMYIKSTLIHYFDRIIDRSFKKNFRKFFPLWKINLFYGTRHESLLPFDNSRIHEIPSFKLSFTMLMRRDLLLSFKQKKILYFYLPILYLFPPSSFIHSTPPFLFLFSWNNLRSYLWLR